MSNENVFPGTPAAVSAAVDVLAIMHRHTLSIIRCFGTNYNEGEEKRGVFRGRKRTDPPCQTVSADTDKKENGKPFLCAE